MLRELYAVAQLSLSPDGLALVPGVGSQRPGLLLTRRLAAVLESFIQDPILGRALELYRARNPAVALADVRQSLLGDVGQSPRILVRAGRIICDGGSKSVVLRGSDAVRYSLESLCACGPTPELSQADFMGATDELVAAGVLVPRPGTVRFGDLRRLRPWCSNFGATRGTPIDRYYLSHFVSTIRGNVRGDVLEVGGVSANRQVYQFGDVRSYTAMDAAKAEGVNVVGDLLAPHVFEENSFDVILNFNVLEHVRAPWQAVMNMHRWLRPGGMIGTMVPSLQRVHLVPNDYWRMLPAAVDSLHSAFDARKLSVYGNALAGIAALMGLAAEELETFELEAVEPDYPVATCIVGTKG